VASVLIHHGIIPCSPISSSVAISIDALELYRVASLCNPHFSIQAYVKSICDLHGVGFFLVSGSAYLTISRPSFIGTYLANFWLRLIFIFTSAPTSTLSSTSLLVEIPWTGTWKTHAPAAPMN
jgi:hypothetical protein